MAADQPVAGGLIPRMQARSLACGYVALQTTEAYPAPGGVLSCKWPFRPGHARVRLKSKTGS